MRYKFCPLCGAELGARALGDEGQVPWCGNCGRPWFDGFSTCVLNVVTDGKDICLIRQSYGDTERFVGVAGYVKPGETAENAALREVEEEIGLEPGCLYSLGSRAYEARDQLMLGFLVFVERGELTLSGELSEARWFSPEEAYDTVRPGSIIQDFIGEARGILEGQ